TIVPMSTIRAQIAEQLADARRTAAVTTTFDEADLSALIGLHGRQHERFEKEFGLRLSYTSFFVRAVAESLRVYPQLNAELRGTDIVRKHYCAIAVSLDADGAAVAPVIRDADELSVARIEEILSDFLERAATRRLSIDDLRDATFTISNPGAFGSMLSTPGVNLPQCACLALHAIRKRPVARGDEVVVRPMMYLALSFDQRIVDLSDAAEFLRRVKMLIESPIRALLES
ncbi:MAG TPA: 2-oxo acid dehydrogenase subunit E2, partial [Phycisphaerae bacterium]|nr:2-oxo acid dehydrogenase subunit E2 [Phycisphaerae bacterium]